MPPPSKRRKTAASAAAAQESIAFDEAAREEYLTGFHKRKQARIKHAQEEAARKEKEERVRERKKIREQRKEELERHVETVNAMLRDANGERDEGGSGEEEEWEGFEEVPVVSYEDEYVDEDKFTTVTVESVEISRDGFSRASVADGDRELDSPDEGTEHANGEKATAGSQNGKKRIWTKERPKNDKPKKKKKKFKYEGPAERKFTRMKEKSKNKVQAKARRSGK